MTAFYHAGTSMIVSHEHYHILICFRHMVLVG